MSASASPHPGDDDDLIPRDHLAVARTALANERTLLAYVRTALTFTAGGLTLVQLFERGAIHVLGWVCVPLGVVTFALGVRSFRRMRRALAAARQGRSADAWNALSGH